jgi:hypothetical protein
MTITKAPGIDTDTLGTFTGEITRKGTMIDAARQKAKWAIARTGAPLGIGSEGAFGPDPLIPFLASGVEVLLLYEAASQHEIVVQRRTKTNFAHEVVSHPDQLDDFLVRVGFPEHAVIVRPEDPSDTTVIYKGLLNRGDVVGAVREVTMRSVSGRAMVHTDMRAHLNPTRMASIEATARSLALKIARCCPQCGKPGFGLVDVERGLPCRDCQAPTRLIRAENHGCSACGYRQRRRERGDRQRSDPTWCDNCNP